ncbi:hypothetical protein [Photobacterium kishitanii]|uniref:hypothetical protein n=1 Tax=Photobacterium kishitanii TaxID=318456 RepID=UPI00273A352E|nr:hypothetical protein [Photobacterium kishitanii]
MVYIDDKHAKTLVSHKYKICAKPDFIYQDKRGEILVERKMAKRKPILADIVQVKASIICARTKYKKVTRAVISTGSGNYHYIFNQSTNELFEDILMYHKICQAIYRGIERNDTWKTISNSIK